MSQSNELPTLYDFWAPWCAPCRAMSPAIDALAKKLEGKIEVKKVNIDENPKLMEFYRVRAVPTLILVSTDEMMRIVGATSSEVLESKIEEALKSAAG